MNKYTNKKKTYFTPTSTTYSMQPSAMLCGSPGGNVIETEVRPGEYAPDPPQGSSGKEFDSEPWSTEW